MADDERGAEARRFFSDLWADGDPWDLETSPLDQQRYERQLRLLSDRRYGRALEIGCGAGAFTRLLAPLCDHVVAIDIAEPALARARAALPATGNVDFRTANVMEFDPDADGPWDLVVLTETAYYLGWLYPMFEVGWLAHALHGATAPGGRLLLANTFGGDRGIMSDWLIWTYRDLFHRAGFAIEAEETHGGVKETIRFEILLTRFGKPPP